ncbi:MAG: hypothetical protein ABIA97_04060 [Candidatus Omnitrophota bacterium]
MDVGIFLSSKKKLFIWIIGPVLLLCIFSLPFFIYIRSTSAKLSERKFMLKSMPAIIEKISLAQVIVKSYQIDVPKSEIIEWLNSKLNQEGKNSHFAIDSLVIEKDITKDAKEGFIVYAVKIKGKGEFPAIINFFKNIQSSISLLALEGVKLRTMGQASENVYNAEISFSYNNLT